jgi:hypothetical protein
VKSACDGIRDRVPLVLLEEAEPLDAARVGDHIAVCAGCREEMERLSGLLRNLETIGVPEPGEDYWETFLPRLRRRIAIRRVSWAWTGLRPLAWAAAAASVLLLAAAVALNLGPSAEGRGAAALKSLAVRSDPDTLRRTLDTVIPGADISLPGHSGGSLALPPPEDLQRVLDTLLPEEESDLYRAAGDLPPEARRRLLKTLMPDRV